MARKHINIKALYDLRAFSDSSQNLAREMRKSGRQLQSIGKSMSTALTLPIVGLSAVGIKMASDLQESINKSDVAFGSASESIKEFAKTTLKSFGLAESSSLEMASTFGDMGTSMGISKSKAAEMSKALVGVAGDMASFKNITIDRAQTALNAVFTGETESLKTLGIVMTQAELNAFAMAKGINKTVKEMSGAEKVALRYEFILEKTKNSQGDFANTGGNAANQMRILQETAKEVAASFGNDLLPQFTSAIQKVNGFLDGIRTLNPETKTIIITVAALTAAIGPLIYAIGTLSTALAFLAVNPAILAVGLLAAGFVALELAASNTNKVFKVVETATQKMQTAYEKLGIEIDKINVLKGLGKKASVEEIKMALLTTRATVKSTNALIAENIERKKKLIALKKEALEQANAASRQVGKQGEFAGVELAQVAKIEKNIKVLNDELKNLQNQGGAAVDGLIDLENQLKNIGNTAVTNIDKATTSQKEFVDGSDGIKNKAVKAWGDLGRMVSKAIPSDGAYVMPQLTFDKGSNDVSMFPDDGGVYHEDMVQLMDDLNNLAIQGMNDLAVTMGEGLGAAISGNWDGFGDNILATVANFIGTLGKLLIAYGIGTEAFKESLKRIDGVGAVIAGVAMVGLAGAVKGFIAKGPSGSGGGDYSTPSYGGGGGNNYNSGNIVMDTQISGRNLILVQQRESQFSR